MESNLESLKDILISFRLELTRIDDLYKDDLLTSSERDVFYKNVTKRKNNFIRLFN